MHRHKLTRALRCCRLVAVTLIALLALRTSVAQNAQGTILGHVVDSTGAVVASAKIAITNLDTGVTNGLTTNGSGDKCRPGSESGSVLGRCGSAGVHPPGFGESCSWNCNKSCARTSSYEVGNVTNAVEVTGETQMLHSIDQTIGQVFHSDLIELSAQFSF